MESVLPKQELMRRMKKLLRDDDRLIPITAFAKLCGLHPEIIRHTFIYEIEPLTERVQRLVSKAYKAWERGDVAVMRKGNGPYYVEYRKEPKPRITKSLCLSLKNGVIGIEAGLRNKSDYSGFDLKEQLERK